MKSRSWSDEFEEQILQNFGSCKDPPEERKSKIKKLIREELNKNPVLSNVLRENKADRQKYSLWLVRQNSKRKYML